jgi:hypothetical protein
MLYNKKNYSQPDDESFDYISPKEEFYREVEGL